jgi:hypothetical protein
MKIDNIMITQEFLHELFEYCDGEMYWKNHKYKKLNGKKVGCLYNTNYIYVKIKNKHYSLHRLIFLYHYGFLPKNVDHIDCNKSNNKIENLREATRSQNQFNRQLQKNNTSGIKNVSWCKNSNKWKVQLRINNKKKSIGCYHDIKLAELVAIEARNKYHGEFAKHD